MRGLETRMLLANYRVQRAIQNDQSIILDHAIQAVESARAEGCSDALEGISVPPAFFVDEPMLLGAWEWGHSFMVELQDMWRCMGCQNGSGDPCPIHG